MDSFQILGLSEDASLKEIRRGFLRLSLQCHLDKAGESSTLLFQHVNAPYGLLKSGDFDPGKKSSTEAPRRRPDLDHYTTEKLFEDLLRDYTNARDAREQARQHSSRSEQSGHGSGSENSSDTSGMPREADGIGECPICKQAPRKLFERMKKPAEKHQAERIYRPIRQRRSAWPADSPARRRYPCCSHRWRRHHGTQVSHQTPGPQRRAWTGEVFTDLSEFFVLKGAQQPDLSAQIPGERAPSTQNLLGSIIEKLRTLVEGVRSLREELEEFVDMFPRGCERIDRKFKRMEASSDLIYSLAVDSPSAADTERSPPRTQSDAADVDEDDRPVGQEHDGRCRGIPLRTLEDAARSECTRGI